MLRDVLQWTFILSLVAPLPFAIFQKIKHGGVSKPLIIISTLSFIILSISILTIAYGVLKFGVYNIALWTIILTPVYFQYIRKKSSTFKSDEESTDTVSYYFRNTALTILTVITVVTIAYILIQEIPKEETITTTKNSPINEEIETRKYINEEFGVSFSYPTNWETGESQRQATLVLLNEKTGTDATCVLSIINQDKLKIEDYDKAYFQEVQAKMSSNFKGSFSGTETELIILNGKKVSLTTYNVQMVQNNTVSSFFVMTVTALHKGKRFTLVLTTPKVDNTIEYLKEDVSLICNSLIFE